MASLDQALPEGLLVDRAWLQQRGFDRPAIDHYLRSGKLDAAARGLYRKPGPTLKWQNVIYSLSELGYRVHVGHLSALAFHGFQHFLEVRPEAEVRLYGDSRLPKWVNALSIPSKLVEMTRSPFEAFDLGIEEIPFGTWDWPIRHAGPERAFLELTSTVTTSEEIRRAERLMEGAVNLRPALLQSLLEECRRRRTMDTQNPYSEQVRLLVRILPIVATAECLALKGGTAINLFYRDIPRLSVDIDLAYTPIKGREESLREITSELSRVGGLITDYVPRSRVRHSTMERSNGGEASERNPKRSGLKDDGFTRGTCNIDGDRLLFGLSLERIIVPPWPSPDRGVA